MSQRHLPRFRAAPAACNRSHGGGVVWRRNGRVREMPPSSRSPAMEWIMEVSSASGAVSGGMIPGSRAASMDLPDPGAPIIRRWWRPAAAISSARLARSCPRTSDRQPGQGHCFRNLARTCGLKGRAVGQVGDKLRQRGGCEDGCRADPGSLRSAALRAEQNEVVLACRQRRGERTVHGDEAPVERHLPQRHGRRDLVGRARSRSRPAAPA
jgi:hypothetical protein